VAGSMDLGKRAPTSLWGELPCVHGEVQEGPGGGDSGPGRWIRPVRRRIGGSVGRICAPRAWASRAREAGSRGGPAAGEYEGHDGFAVGGLHGDPGGGPDGGQGLLDVPHPCLDTRPGPE